VAVVVDDLTAWLVGLLADAGRKKLTSWVLGTEQERALRQAAAAAVERTAGQLAPAGGGQAEQMAMVVGEVFRETAPDAAVARPATLLEALQEGIARQLAVLDDPDITGTGQSSAALLGVPGQVLAGTLARHLVWEITVRGSRGGPLAPLADQLNHDVTHLQGRQLEGMLAQLAEQVTMALARAGGPEAPRKPVRLLPRPALLAGREELLAELDTRLAGDGPGPRVAALYGLGGAGKTSAAMEYAHRYLAEVGVAWQFAAEDPTVLAAGFGELAAQLGASDAPGTRDPVASVHSMLAAFPAPWLLVFDNAPDRAAVEAFLPPAGHGRVLVTSQNPHWPPGQALDVPVLGTEVAADFLVGRTGDAAGQAARELAVELGGLPLALEQAAAYMQASSTSLARYLELFRARQADLLARGEAAGHRQHVAATLGLALARLEGDAPAAAGLLRLLAFLAPEPAPLGLLLAGQDAAQRLGAETAGAIGPLLGDPVAAGDAVAALRRYSLAAPTGDGLVQVHRLVQAVTRAQLTTAQAAQWKQAAAALVEAAIPADGEPPAAWPTCALLLPHARAVLDLTSDGTWQAAQALGYSGSYKAARDLFTLIANAHQDSRDYGPEHPRTLEARAHVAYWAGAAGDVAGARDQFAALLPIHEQILGSDHPETLIVRANLAAWTGRAGDVAGARDQYAVLLPIYEQILGPEHPNTLITRYSLASWTGRAGDAAGARDQYIALLPVVEQILGPDHPETLIVRANLALWTGQAGDAAGARDQYIALLPIREQILGPEHPNTLTTRANLAYWTGQAGDAAGARDQYIALLPIREQIQGPDHPDTLTDRANLAYWAGEAGDDPGAG
jgi:Tetratricopeptide repeat